MDIRKLQRAIVDGLEDVKAQDIAVFNTEALSPLFERVIIACGTSNRQTKALAASVRDAVKGLGEPVPRVEGEENGEWIIVDCGAAVAHIMQPAIRDYYRLEEIWGVNPVTLKSAVKKARSGLPKAEEPAAPAKKVRSTPSKTLPPRKTAATSSALGATKPVAKKTAARKAAVASAPAARKPAAKRASAAKTVTSRTGESRAVSKPRAARKRVG